MGEGRSESTRSKISTHITLSLLTDSSGALTGGKETQADRLAVNGWPQIQTFTKHKAKSSLSNENRGEGLRLTADLEAVDSLPCCIVAAVGDRRHVWRVIS